MFKKYLWMNVIALSCLYSPVLLALQVKPITDNGKAEAFAATQGITRIAVDQDRITNVRGPAGAYQMQNDNSQGAIFIQPTAAYQKKPFTLFIATEQNHNYVLRIIPRDQNADTILLQPQDAKNPQAAAWEQASPYTQSITQLMNAMANQATPEGYSRNNLIKSPQLPLGNLATIQLKQVYFGANLQGQIYQVTNKTQQTLYLNEREFYQVGDRAIALSNLVVPPKGQTYLYKVRSHG